MENNLPTSNKGHHAGMPGLKSLVVFLLIGFLIGVILLLTGSYGSMQQLTFICLLSSAFGWVIWTLCGWLPIHKAPVLRLRYMLSAGIAAYILTSNVAHPVLTLWNNCLVAFFPAAFPTPMPVMSFLAGAVLALLLMPLFQRFSATTE